MYRQERHFIPFTHTHTHKHSLLGKVGKVGKVDEAFNKEGSIKGQKRVNVKF